MCGIVGFISGAGKTGFPGDRLKYFKLALMMDSVRGMDSTGMFLVENSKELEEPVWERGVCHGWDFVQDKAFDKTFGQPGAWRAAIGHNRSATVGSITLENAHPFQEGPITLVHNGTLQSTYGLPLAGHELKQEGVSVDSHMICHNLATHPLQDVYKKLDGAWALVWHDKRDGSINIVRNTQRPLHFAKVKNEDTLVLASEADMLQFVAKRATMQIGPVYYPKAHMWFKWLPDTPVNAPITEKLPEPIPYKYTNYSRHNRGNVYAGRGWEYDEDDYGYSGYPSTHKSWWEVEAERKRAAAEDKAKAEDAETVPFDVPERDLRVPLCGKLRDVPEAHKAVLLEFELTTADLLTFYPQSVIEAGSKNRVAVAGNVMLDGEVVVDMPAVVYGVDSVTAYGDLELKAAEPMWTVRPLTVYQMDTEPEHIDDWAILVCKIVRTGYRSRPAQPIDRRGRYAKGPTSTIPLAAYMGYVRDGCDTCGAEIRWEDDHTLSWIQRNNVWRPRCQACTTRTIMTGGGL